MPRRSKAVASGKKVPDPAVQPMDHASSADIIVRISQNGNVTASCDEEHVPKAWNILAATKGKDSPIAHVGCLTEEQKDAIAQRLAQLIISERT